MCQRRTCPQCNKPGFTGCGEHVEEVLGDVAIADRCQCDPAPEPEGMLGRFFKS